ncbi:ImpA family type VI secretion system protein [Pseudaestuariivita rosea]|uniref:type VI secretion system protein TssA n=1 Tax=Pseudaestuariivita rosea TaxID=2763263 RepID=UPI001ABA6487|nr:type VI secretion system ImpA family N-terminal domain-containing protein [Pseudaestuariivita rosea]
MNDQAAIEADPLAAAISAEAPIGVDIRENDAAKPLYYKLRDLRSHVRAEERRLEKLESVEQSLVVCPEWKEVKSTAEEVLANHSKDIEVLAWLIEADTRLSGFQGLARGYGLLLQYLETFGTDLFPLPEETEADRYDPLTGLNGGGREGALIQPLRLVSLLPGGGYGNNAYWFRQSGNEAALVGAIGEAGNDVMLQQFGHIEAARAAIRQSDQILTEKYGADAPPFGLILETLDEIIMWLSSQVVAPVDATEDSDEVAKSGAKSDAKASGAITTRDEAFARLMEIAAFFRKTEPHSPISHALETIVDRGRMDFMKLLEELIPDENMRRSFMTTAGIRKKADSE